MNLIKDFISLFYPRLCYICENSLFKNEVVVCTRCALHLPETNFHLDEDNPVSRVFWGRVEIERATALYYYKKGGSVQTLIHQLKYHGHKEIGIYLGQLYGAQLMEVEDYKTMDMIIPIPLHKKKLKQRGFNQAETFARGLAGTMEKELVTDNVYRAIATSTQTKKGRYKRWENVSDIFRVREPENLANKHILLVDDVITTGATMEACLQTLKKINGTKLSVASIAFASH
ncbi:MAG: ComF family protein [Bacteroidales bacterium]|nr:ComF family protein [Bacteroidales bacterium]MCF8403193.1 ComF family protein [Bacteroidales bacterium]